MNRDTGGIRKFRAGAWTLTLLAMAVVTASAGEWEQYAKDAQGSGRQDITASVVDLETPLWETSGHGLEGAGGASVCLLGGDPARVFAWGVNQDRSAVHLKAFRTSDGSLVWTSPPLDPGMSLSNWTWSSPSADDVTGDVFFGVGSSVYRLDGGDGHIVKQTQLTDSGSSTIVNASCHIGGGMVFISTYGGVQPSQKRLYAIRVSDGSIAWSRLNGGQGSEAVVYLEDGGSSNVYCLLDHGMACYQADDGTTVWTSSAPDGATPWSTDLAFHGGISYHDGSLLAATFTFGAEGGELVRVDAQTGELEWRATGTVSGDATPVVVGDAVIIAGADDWGAKPSAVAAYDFESGTELWRSPVAGGPWDMWNVSVSACSDALYVTEGDWGQGLHVLDPATGAEKASTTTASRRMRGTPAIGADGSVYALNSAKGLSCYRSPGFAVADQDGDVAAGKTDERGVVATLIVVGAQQMRISETSGGGAWVPYLPSSVFTLSSSLGAKTVYAQTKDGSGVGPIMTATIDYSRPLDRSGVLSCY